MKRILGLALCFLLCGVFPVLAVDTSVTGTQLKEELNADKQKIAQERQEMKKKAEAAKAEEQGVHKQIREARAAGDKEKVKTLEAQLKSMHKENVAGRKADHKELQQARQELRKDRKAAKPVKVQ